MSPRYFPREGFTREAAYAPLRLTALNPFFTGPLLLALKHYPERFQKLLNLLPPDLVRFLPNGQKFLQALLALGALRVLNNWYSRKTVNNWVSDTYNWSQEIVLISGGAGGIGLNVVKDLASRGIKVIALDLKPPQETLPKNAFYYKCDITSSAAIKEMAEAVRKDHGHPTIIINNAGVGFGEEILGEAEEKIRLTMNVNLISHFLMAKEFVPHLVERNHGHVITIASMASFGTNAQNADYAASKAGVLAFHEALTVELSHRYGAPRVRTSIFHPIWVRTPFIHDLADSPNFKDFLLEPETVSDAIVEKVLSGEGGQVFLPGRFALAPLIRALPQWFGHKARIGISNTLSGMIDDGNGKGVFREKK